MEGLYLLHFDPPLAHARHYLGWAKSIEKRTREHFNGTRKSSPLLRAALAQGSTLTLARVWEGEDRNYERRLKNRGGLARQCPICKGEPC